MGVAGIGGGQQLLEMGEVVVAEDLAHRARVADAGDHRGVVEGVGIELAARQHRAQGLQGGLVGDVARGEDERGFLAVQRGELALERHVQRVGAGDVARAAGARALGADRGLHGLEHDRMLAHRQIVVAAPDRDVARRCRRDASARAGRRRRCAPAPRTRGSGPRRAGVADDRRRKPRSPFCPCLPPADISRLASFSSRHILVAALGKHDHVTKDCKSIRNVDEQARRSGRR